MNKMLSAAALAFALLLVLAGCQKKDVFSTVQLTDYMDLQVGRYVHYRLDSLRYIDYGQKDTVISYDAKDVIEAAITDNLGRPGFRLVRYLRDTASQNEYDWKPAATIEIIPTRNTLEWVEDNFRFQKLKLPIVDGFNWKGNSYIQIVPTDPTDINWDYRYLDDWDYTYANIDQPFSAWNNQQVDSTITVNERDEIIGDPNDPSVYSEKNYSQEVWGKGIGLVYRNFIHWVYQPPQNGNPGYTDGYGITLTMIDHN